MDGQKNKNLISRGKRLAFLLRHDKNYPFDEHGWREISDPVSGQDRDTAFMLMWNWKKSCRQTYCIMGLGNCRETTW